MLVLSYFKYLNNYSSLIFIYFEIKNLNIIHLIIIMDYCCYIIYNYNCSYVGITNNPVNRIKRHNQEMSGGAKYTKMIGTGWKYICQIHGFKNKIHALQFEWAVKHMEKYKKGIENRILNLFKILNKPRWTNKSPSSINYNLKVIWNDITFIPENYTLPNYIDMDIVQ